MHEVLEIRFDQQQAVSLSLLIASTLGFGSTLFSSLVFAASVLLHGLSYTLRQH